MILLRDGTLVALCMQLIKIVNPYEFCSQIKLTLPRIVEISITVPVKKSLYL